MVRWLITTFALFFVLAAIGLVIILPLIDNIFIGTILSGIYGFVSMNTSMNLAQRFVGGGPYRA